MTFSTVGTVASDMTFSNGGKTNDPTDTGVVYRLDRLRQVILFHNFSDSKSLRLLRSVM